MKLLSGLITNGSRPLSIVWFSIFGIDLGCMSFTASEIALIWSGVVPQHPPTKFTSPA